MTKRNSAWAQKQTPSVHTQLATTTTNKLEMLKINKIAFNQVKVTKVLVINGIIFFCFVFHWVGLHWFLLREDFWLVFIWSSLYLFIYYYYHYHYFGFLLFGLHCLLLRGEFFSCIHLEFFFKNKNLGIFIIWCFFY